MSCRHRERGASAPQYVGMVIVSALIVTGIVAAVVPERLATAVSRAICMVTGQTNCPVGGDSSQQDAEKTPLQKATWGSAWFGGDSFASGEGVGNYEPGTDVTGFNILNPLTWGNVKAQVNPVTGEVYLVPDTHKNMCHRSTLSYQAQVFTTLQGQGYFSGQEYSSAACSGSEVPNLYSDNKQGNAEGPQAMASPLPSRDPHQFDKIPSDASLISLSLGGNDVRFAGILQNCIVHFGGSPCGSWDEATAEDPSKANDPATAAAVSEMDRVYGTAQKPGILEVELRQMKQQHPDARIIIVGYPQLFAEVDDTQVTVNDPYAGFPTTYTVPNGTSLTLGQQRWANGMSGKIDAHISDMCIRLGIEFIDPTSLYSGPGYDHRLGSSDPWINPMALWSPGGNLTVDPGSFHPNQQGHDAEAGLLLQIINEGSR